MADNTSQIAAHEALINSGASSVTTDGQTTNFVSPADLRKALVEAVNKDDHTNARGRARPPVMRVKFNGIY